MGILDGKAAIVTGAGKGLGVGEAVALAKEGASVTCVARTLADVENTAAQIREVGGTAIAMSCDVRDRAQCEKVVADTVAQFGSIDILVNNAQIIPQPKPFEEWTEQEMRDTWESGVLGSWFFMMACFPHFKGQGRGKIINTCSGAGHGHTGQGFCGYGTAKEGVRGMTRMAAREWGRYGINVNVISPAALSDAVVRLYPSVDACLESIGMVVPRLGDAERDIGRSVVYLAGPDSDHVTGHTLSVDGGLAMW